MKEHPNFYENIEEAIRRIRGTVVAYDGAPYYVGAITNHKPDGIFRVYLEPVNTPNGRMIPSDFMGGSNGPSLSIAAALDKFLDTHPQGHLVLRKQINSPKFNRFRPFPLGMVNWKNNNNASAFYCVRQPVRNKEQGLTDRMLLSHRIRLGISPSSGSGGGLIKHPTGYEPTIFSSAFVDCVQGTHPTLEQVLANLNDSECTNESVAFHREFAVARGPVGTLFLVYKKDVVGVLPNNDKSKVVLSSLFQHTLEAVSELGAFDNITVKSVQH